MPDLPAWHKCNSHCVMCTNCDAYILDPDEKYSLAKHRAKIAEFKARPWDRTVYYRNGELPNFFQLTGGEPTLHPEFFKLLGEYRKAFPETPLSLLTNGRSFYYESFAKSTLAIGGVPFDVAVPVHGPDARTHDSVTRAPGSFAETAEGLGHLFRHRLPEQGIEIRIILHRRPAEWLPDTLDFLLKTFPELSGDPAGRAGDSRLTLIYFEVEGQAEKNYRHIAITLTECAARVDACRERLSRFSEVRLYHFPLCTLPKRLWPWAWRTLPRYEIRHVSACRSCAVNDACLGPHDWYPRLVGEAEFVPFQERPSLALSGSYFHPIASVGEGSVPWTPASVEDEAKDESARW